MKFALAIKNGFGSVFVDGIEIHDVVFVGLDQTPGEKAIVSLVVHADAVNFSSDDANVNIERAGENVIRKSDN